MKKLLLTSALIASALTSPTLADVTLPVVFSEHMVLQRSARTPIWGFAAPGENVNVTIGVVRAQAVTNDQGRWNVNLDLSKVGDGPFEVTLKGKNTVTIGDVLVGDVWLCSGQSNMDFNLDRILDAPKEIEASTNSQLRMFVPKGWTASFDPLTDTKGVWLVAGPETSGKFSAVAYFFGQKLQSTLKRPIGLVHTSWGGTKAEAWMSKDAFPAEPSLTKTADDLRSRILDFPTNRTAYAKAVAAWENRFKLDYRAPEDVSTWVAADADLSNWGTVKLPNAKGPAPEKPQEVHWFRRTVELPPNLVGKKLTMIIANIHQLESVYWNGKLLGSHDASTYPGNGPSEERDTRHYYTAPAEDAVAGPNVLAIRLQALNGFPAIGSGYFLIQDERGSVKSYLAGDWKTTIETPERNPSAEALAAIPIPVEAPPMKQNVPGALFNGMLAPLIPYGITGILWYQGEANVGQAEAYAKIFPAMITDWRAHWKNADLPFYFCQLPNFTRKGTEAGKDSSWADLRFAQTAALALPNTGMAVTIDVGEGEDIHPREKKIPGERLAALALAKTYGKTVPFQGPIPQTMKVEGSKVRLQFANTGAKLIAGPIPEEYVLKSMPRETAPLVRNAPDGDLESFELCDKDGKWSWATARISGKDVIVESPDIPKPVAVRYGWSDNPTCNLYNEAGLPAAPFRSDNYTLSGANKKSGR